MIKKIKEVLSVMFMSKEEIDKVKDKIENERREYIRKIVIGTR